MSNEICIIGVYFGKFHNYFNLWMNSAAKNDSIDFLIVTDQIVEQKFVNIKTLNISFDETRKLIERKLDRKVKLKKPYKLCDFKPAYGYIFSDYIKEYQYWGHCDFDLIWGDLRGFLNEYKYDQYDRFLERGHLTLYRNTKRINSLFKVKVNGEPGYRTIFSNGHNYLFDEGSILEKICEQEKVKVFKERLAADIDVVHKRFRHAFENTERTKNYAHQVFYYENGHVYMNYIEADQVNRKEYLYIHLQKRKELNLNVTNLNSYYITSSGFYDKNDCLITPGVIDQYNPYPGIEAEMEEREIYDASMWKSRFKAKVAQNLIGRIIVGLFNFVKYKFK